MKFRHGITVVKDNRPGRKQPWLVRWYGEYDFQTASKKRLCRSFSRQSDAEIHARQLQDELDRGLDPENKDFPVGDFLNRYLEFKKKEVRHSSYELYQKAKDEFEKYFNPSVPIRKIDQETCEKFISNLGLINKYHKKKKKNLSDSSRHQYLRLLKTIFKKAVKWGYIDRNPFEDISLRTPARKAWYYIQPQDFKNILITLDTLPVFKREKENGTIRKIRLKAFYSIMYGCGLRFGEAVNLLWDDQNIDLKEEMVHIVNRAGSPDMPVFNIKDYESRSIKMPKFVVQAIEELKRVDGKSSPFLFLCKDQWERALNRWHSFQEKGIVEQWDSKELAGSARRDFQSYCRLAGITTHKKLNLHSLRKGYGSNMAKLCPPHTLRELMGHSSIITSMEYYVQDVDENKKKAVEDLDRMMGE